MNISLRALKARLAVAYMATAANQELGTGYPDCDPGNSFTRYQAAFMNGWNEVEGVHPYSEVWMDIEAFYKSQGWDKLCDEELLDLANGARAVGFTTKQGSKVQATSVHSAIKLWMDRGWYRYEHQRSRRRGIAGKATLVGLAIFGIPVVGDL